MPERPDLPYTDPVLGGCYVVCDHWIHGIVVEGCDACRCGSYVNGDRAVAGCALGVGCRRALA